MLTDFELFVMTWVLGVLSFASIFLHLYSSFQIFYHQANEKDTEDLAARKTRLSLEWATRIRRFAIAVFVPVTLAGIVVDILRWIPIWERDPTTWLYRIMCVSVSFFALLLLGGSLLIYTFHGIGIENNMEAHTSAQ